METTSLKDLLREHIELKGLTPKKIADITGIHERYIVALLEGTDGYLPPAPYVYGYITKLSAVLNFEKENMWRLYQKESLLRSAGAHDRLPANRFAMKPISRAWIIGGIIALAALAYLGSNIVNILTQPELTITVPAQENTAVAQPTITVQGATNPTYTLSINQAEVYIDKDGSFKKEFQLQEGLNAIEFVAKKFLGKETRVIRHIIYTPAALEELTLPTPAAPPAP